MAENPQKKSASSISKIAPYPIAVEIFKEEGKPPLKANIVKMTEIGFLMKIETIHFYKVGEVFTLQFKLPVVNSIVRCEGKVMKTYDAVDKLYTVEIHFKNIMDREKTAIVSYLSKSGQKKF